MRLRFYIAVDCVRKGLGGVYRAGVINPRQPGCVRK